jgi:hypothetical protein
VAIAAALVALFVAGTLVGVYVNRDQKRISSGNLPAGHPQLPESNTGTSAPASEASKSPDVGGEGGRVPAGSVKGSDAEVLGQPPRAEDLSPPTDAVTTLDQGFGVALLPSSLGGLARNGAPSITASEVSAVYTGPPQLGIESAQVVVRRFDDKSAAGSGAAEMAGEYPIGPIVFSLGGRKITQMITDEPRPEMFPPAMSFTWVQGRYAVQVIAVPWEPSSCERARDAAMQMIAELSF